MKNIIGLDLGTNSIGWAKVSIDEFGNYIPTIEMGSRIIPMSQDILGKFNSGVTESQTAIRTSYRGIRRLRERELLRRERLFRVLHTLNFLPPHFDTEIGWDRTNTKTFGKFIHNNEPKIAWAPNPTGKMQFVYQNAFNEMLADFKQHQPQLVSDNKKIPCDWTIYYLRHKALTQAISKEELAWIILSFNQKRGYYQLRGEDEEINDTKKEEFYVLKVINVEATDNKRGDDIWYNVYLENGWIYRRSSKISLLNWIGKNKEFIVTTDYNKDGTPKLDNDGQVKRSFRAPKEDDWTLLKKRTESLIEESNQTVGDYIYTNLLTNPFDKIRGKLVRTIERKYYKEELTRILKKQAEFIPELTSPQALESCILELYSKNTAHQDSLRKKDLAYLIINDLIFYQRPLKSKKSLIANCPYESYDYIDKETGEIKQQHIKCIAKSNPYFQEFRLWQFIQNLRIYDKDNFDKDVTSSYLPSHESYAKLYEWLNDRKEIKQETLFKDFFGVKIDKKKPLMLRWNYVEDKVYPCNETRGIMLSALKKASINNQFLNNKENEYLLWHILYSVEDKNEIKSALGKYAIKFNLPENFVDAFSSIPSLKKEYGAYSEKAIKKLLSLMRCGHYWDKEAIENSIKQRINNVIEGSIDEEIKKRISNQEYQLATLEDFQGLPTWLACYIVYNRHSESQSATKWKKPEDLLAFIYSFKQNSLRNPIVEQCVLEALRTVYDLWKKNGHIDEIHVELGREMKNPADKRRAITNRNLDNENTNLRLKYLLQELSNDGKTENVHPYSPMQQEILKIYEEGALLSLTKDDPEFDFISKVSKNGQPSHNELIKYKLWLEQKYRSPYTGDVIPLGKLFTPSYQIEHVIPQARYFDDSLSNKVICEAEVNQEKSNRLGMEFIRQEGGRKIQTSRGKVVQVFNAAEYETFVKEHYNNSRAKMKKMLMDDIPEEFVQRQLNDSRYISKLIVSLLSNIVRDEDELESKSKFVIPCTGGITDRLKKDWGLNDVWNHLVYERFERLNQITGRTDFGYWDNKEGKKVFQTMVPLEYQKGFSKKRIDHRHHAMDALVIACASHNIISYLNNESAKDTKRREDLKHLLCSKGRVINKPWSTFTQDSEKALQEIIVSFKNNTRVINKASNYYEHYDETGKKVQYVQHGESQWAVRKPLHKETVFGRTNLKRIKTVALSKALDNVNSIVDKELKEKIVSMFSNNLNKKRILESFKDNDYKFKETKVDKVEVYYFTDDETPLVAVRKKLDTSFDEKRIKESITDTGIQKILLNYLAQKDNNPEKAFTPEGVMEMNANIASYNNGKPHQPIEKVRVYEPLGGKYPVGYTGNKKDKYVVAQKGTNLFYAIYEDEEGVRNYETIPLNVVIEREKQGLSPVAETNSNGEKLKFYLSPNDLVYVPNEDELLSRDVTIDRNRIYKLVSSTGNRSFFIQAKVATSIIDKVEYTSLNKIEKSIDGITIKAVCWKLIVNRLGEITQVIR